jgi:hypothetical protein
LAADEPPAKTLPASQWREREELLKIATQVKEEMQVSKLTKLENKNLRGG